MTEQLILLEKFNTPFEAVPFDKIKQEDFKPSFEKAMEIGKERVEKIMACPDTPTFENTILMLENALLEFDRVSNVFFNLCSAETNDFLENLQAEISPVLSAFTNDLYLNPKLFERVKAVYDNEYEKLKNEEDKKLLKENYLFFVRNGALLDKKGQDQLKAIDEALAKTGVEYSQNVLKDTNAYFMHLKNIEDLDGLQEDYKQQAVQDAKDRDLEGWVVTLDYPSYIPFMTYANNRALRKELHLAMGQRAFKNDELNNEDNIKKIVQLRQERAQLLGYKNHADYVLENRMAKSVEKVLEFLNELKIKAQAAAERDFKAIQEMAGTSNIEAYDHGYYSEKLRLKSYDISDEVLKPYFSLQNVKAAAFDLASKLFGLNLEKRTDVPVYHPDVEVYEVLESGQHKGLLYMDWHPRKGKRAGAWMTSFKDQYKDKDGNHRPHVAIVCNFSKPIGDKPSLLTFNEVTTLFHELGHAFHGLLADTTYKSLSGTSVRWDFVELPSQFLENYCYEPEFLQSFAKHYKTNEPIPTELIDRIADSAAFMEGYQTYRQLSFGLLDMHYHTEGISENESIEDFEEKIMGDLRLYPKIEGTAMSPSFSHIFAGGYAAGYYSYKWAEVLDADAFAYFKAHGIFNQEIANKYRRLLSSGGTIEPMDLYVAFRGQEPNIDALVERAQLLKV